MKIAYSLLAFVLVALNAIGADNPIQQPFLRVVYKGDLVHRFVTDKLDAGVAVAGTAAAEAADGYLRLNVTGTDPQIILRGFPNAQGPLCLSFRTRLTGGGMGVLYWGDSTTPGYSGDRQVQFLTEYDGEWHDHIIQIPVSDRRTDLRLDLGSEHGGTIDIAGIALYRGGRHPLEITAISQQASSVTATLHNHSNEERVVRFRDRDYTVPANATLDLIHPLAAHNAVQAVNFRIEAKGLRPIERQVWVHDPDVGIEAMTLQRKGVRLAVARDGSLARIYVHDQLQAIMAPLALVDGRLPNWTAHDDNSTIDLNGEVGATIRFEDDGILSIRSDADAEIEMVIRVLGGLEQAIFPGLEYLGKGETSSSRLDYATDQHFRFMPDVNDITWPALMLVTDRQSVSLRWESDKVRPTFASPNFVDGAADHRLSLRGKSIRARFRIGEPAPILESILWAVRDMGLPALPERPRSDAEQAALCRQAFDGPLRHSEGWGHCVEDNYARKWYADLASAFWALGGDLTKIPKLVPGGGHIRDDRSFFLTNGAETWLQLRRGEAERTLSEMRSDGSFRYQGKYRKGHFEDTASGYCGKRALTLLRFAELTGDKEARNAGLKALEYIRKFRTPRGAQTWELSLHTPDILAAAHLVEACLIGYRLSGDKRYVTDARKWAASGLPFVYLRGDKPVQAYATIPVFGASSWVAPNWIGKPVQWNGLLYAYAIARLARLDDSFPWQQVAKGIVIAAEQMQEADGPRVGCLPDYWFLDGNGGGGPAINPSVIQSAAARAWGGPAGLQTAIHKGRHVTSPFLLEARNGVLHVLSRPGTQYQVVIDGERIRNLTGAGNDVIELP